MSLIQENPNPIKPGSLVNGLILAVVVVFIRLMMILRMTWRGITGLYHRITGK